MPCINRVRIINFSYNNDARHILDETFHFHGGENALLNLANGGGKSVLVQVMLQPVVPRAKIQNRSIAEFFKKKKTPSYILIEWRLDDAGGYLLTGIAMAPVETRSAEEEEKGRIRLFCFLVRYTQANPYDLANIDLVRHDEGLVHITSYKQAQEMMQEARRKDSLNISYFPQDELEEHRRRLGQFGISQDEWKHVLVRINDSEGGLEDIFSKCRTSDQLLNEWLIRTIDKALALTAGKDREDDRSLQTMFENLLNETINSEAFLMEQQILRGFSPGFESLRDQAAQLAAILEARNGFESGLASMSRSLGKKAEEIHEQKRVIEDEMERIGEKLLQIDREESSLRYYQFHDLWVSADADKKLAQGELDKALGESEASEVRLKAMRGAGIRARMEACNARISALKERLSDALGGGEATTRLHLLEAALLRKWNERVNTLVAERMELEKRHKALVEEREALKRQDVELGERHRCLSQEQARIKRRIDIFEADEERIGGCLNLQPARNLAGELSQQEASRLKGILEKRIMEAERTKAALEREEKQLKDYLSQSEVEVNLLDADRQRLMDEIKELSGELEAYRKATEVYRHVLTDNGLAQHTERASAQAALGQSLIQLRLRISQNERDIHSLTSVIDDLRFGRYHIRGEWISYLEEANIPYQTGEDYLRKLNHDSRDQMLRVMPLLPYCLLLAPDAIAALPEMMRDKIQKNVVPVVTYDALKQVMNGVPADGSDLESTGRAVGCQTGGGVPFILTASYNRGALDPESVETLMGKTQRQYEEMKASLENMQEAQSRLIRDIQTVDAYPYTPSWKQEMELLRTKTDKTLSELDSRLSGLKEKRKQAEQRLSDLDKLLVEKNYLLKEQMEEAKDWSAHMAANGRYEADRREWADNSEILRESEMEAERIRSREAEINNQMLPEVIAVKDAEKREKYGLAKVKEYEGSTPQPGENDPEGTCEELEFKRDALLRTMDNAINDLKYQLKDQTEELSKVSRELKKLNLPEDLVLPRYDADSEENLERESLLATKFLDDCRKRWHEADKREGVTKADLGHARDQLGETGLGDPLDKAHVYGNFEDRRHRLKLDRSRMSEDGRELEKELGQIEAALGRIADVIDLSLVKPAHTFELDEAWKPQMDRIINALKGERERFDGGKSRFITAYGKLRNDYGKRDPILESLFDGLDVMLAKASDSYEPFYYLYERMTDHAGILAQHLSMLNTRLESLDKNRADVVQHCWFHGGKIYEELKRIEQKSAVRLEGRVTPVSMLRIQMELDSQDAARLRMQNHIEKSLQHVREDCRSGKDAREIRNSIERLIQSRELLNAYLGTTRIPVSVYKIDLTMNNSRAKVWEDAVRENSGGEKFVIYFAILAALMAYSRSQEQPVRSGGEDTARAGKRVLIMDNPFGPISSQHLLKPLFEIAKRYQTQLICLTDLKQSSILNNFNLVYMLRVRRGAASSNEYLKFEQYKRSESVEENDESLEKAFYRVTDYKQMKMWE